MQQNDLLGHKATKVFFTHGGLNSVLEGAYHGTPMVVLPLFGDQPANAMKVHEAGIGVILDLQNLTPIQVKNAITEVLRNPKYKENALTVSKRIRDRRVTPTEEACDWIEYGLHNNAGLHLRSQADNLSFIQLYLLDVLLAIGLVILCLIILYYFFLKYCLICIAQMYFPKVKTE
ncbi:UDP-glucuronosyltransferase 1-1 [Desmophyllum pertusum]|uniref:UDP-glucuronosyltransferase 1-1 n=1 Tax=Desmophyllum pertusum TaxID=174260 RepID=A0A9X0A2E9_9CNID|nr:UDP-glucuronosyltransferase 1-1 [Desmophyllum pertusum]